MKKYIIWGHLISGDDLKPGSGNVAAIMRMQNAIDKKSMQQFFGFVNYLAIICKPLHKLICKDKSWTWQSEQEGYSSTCPSML